MSTPAPSKRGAATKRALRVSASFQRWSAAAVVLTSFGTALAAEPVLSGKAVPDRVRAVLLDILKQAELDGALVTSTTRTAAEQAKVMFDFINRNGLEAALELYGPHGDAIIKVCGASYKQHSKCTEPILPKMVDETRRQLELLVQQGDRRTELMHTSDTHFTIDIAPESISDPSAFEAAVAADRRVSRFLKPPLDRNSYHLEIPRE
ncbi:MAG TPA: hypothetical protein VI197_33330 [Polyangiaceae bacterium]